MSGRCFCEAHLRTNYNLTKRNEWDAERNNRYGRCHSHMGDLAKAASGFILAIGVDVRRDLQKKRERNQRQKKRRWPGEFAEDGMYSEQHFRASPKDRLSGKGPRRTREKDPT